MKLCNKNTKKNEEKFNYFANINITYAHVIDRVVETNFEKKGV